MADGALGSGKKTLPHSSEIRGWPGLFVIRTEAGLRDREAHADPGVFLGVQTARDANFHGIGAHLDHVIKQTDQLVVPVEGQNRWRVGNAELRIGMGGGVGGGG